MNKIKTTITNQNEKTILIFPIQVKELLDISYFNSEAVKLNKNILEFIESENIIPNSIIINLELKKFGIKLNEIYDNNFNSLDLQKIINISKNLADIPDELKGKIAFVIYGQHILKAFEYTKKDLPLMVTAIVDLNIAEAIEIFTRINSTYMSESSILDFLGVTEHIFPEYFKFHRIIQKLNEEDIESPFYQNIKMLGIGKGLITEADIYTAVKKYKIEEKLKQIGIEPDEETLYNVIWNFFKAVQKEYPNFWNKKVLFSKARIRILFTHMGILLNYFNVNKIVYNVENIQNYLKNFGKNIDRKE